MVLEIADAGRPQDNASTFNERALQALGITTQGSGRPRASVAIGFVDYGFDLLHPTLLSATGSRSRFRYLWDQNRTPRVERDPDIDLDHVEDWDGACIDEEVAAAIASGSRRKLDQLYDPHENNGSRFECVGGAHGTLMASMAAGTPANRFRGAASRAALIGVQLALADYDWKEHDSRGRPTWSGWDPEREPVWSGWRSYDASPQIISAVRYIYNRACRLSVDAVVINLSIGAWAGAHDGNSPVEQAIANLIAGAGLAYREGRGPRTIVVAGSGNAGADEGHWTSTLSPRSTASFDWIMQRGDPSQNKLEVWYERSGGDLDVGLELPDGSFINLRPGRTHEIISAHQRVGIAEHVLYARGRLARVRLLIHPPFLPGTVSEGVSQTCAFKVRLANGSMKQKRIHAWVERDDGAAERSWLFPSHGEGSLCCLATIPGAVTVAGYDLDQATGEAGLLPASSCGPAPWANDTASRIPHFAAPAHGIWGARSKTRGFAQTTGTSAAVALASGAIAAHLGANGADAALPPKHGDWNSRHGFGPFRIDCRQQTGAPA